VRTQTDLAGGVDLKTTVDYRRYKKLGSYRRKEFKSVEKFEKNKNYGRKGQSELVLKAAADCKGGLGP